MRSRSVLVGAGLVMVGLVASAGPAAAKGISDGVIEGAALGAPVEVDARTLYEDLDLDMADLGFAFTTGGPTSGGQPLELTAAAPVSRLGPELTVTWTVEGQTETIVQQLYPYAAGGPLVHTGAGQALYDMELRSGWFRADQDLVTGLQALGLPERHELAGRAAADSATGSATAEGGSPQWTRGAILAAVAVTGACGLAVEHRRRARRRQLTPAT